MSLELRFVKRMCKCVICQPTKTGDYVGPPCPRPLQRILQCRPLGAPIINDEGMITGRFNAKWQDVPEVDEEEEDVSSG